VSGPTINRIENEIQNVSFDTLEKPCARAEQRHRGSIRARPQRVVAPDPHQQLSDRSLVSSSWSLGCVYTVVVRGETWRANLCARNRSRLAR
jgi:hypothetical protein